MPVTFFSFFMFTSSWYLQKYKGESVTLGKLLERNPQGSFTGITALWLHRLQAVPAECHQCLWQFLLPDSREKAKATHLWIQKSGALGFRLNFLKVLNYEINSWSPTPVFSIYIVVFQIHYSHDSPGFPEILPSFRCFKHAGTVVHALTFHNYFI